MWPGASAWPIRFRSFWQPPELVSLRIRDNGSRRRCRVYTLRRARLRIEQLGIGLRHIFEIFNPQSSRGTDGNTLEPEVGTNYELGVKGEFYNGALNTSLALFRIQKDNEAQLLQPHDPNNICGGWCYEAKGKTTTKGVDLGLSGEVVDGVQVMAGFTQYKKDDNDETVRIAKLSGSYSPENARWSLGANIDNSTKSYGQWGMSQDARTLVGLFGKYQVNPSVELALNIQNVLDKKYYANAIDSGYGNQYWGEPAPEH